LVIANIEPCLSKMRNQNGREINYIEYRTCFFNNDAKAKRAGETDYKPTKELTFQNEGESETCGAELIVANQRTCLSQKRKTKRNVQPNWFVANKELGFKTKRKKSVLRI